MSIANVPVGSGTVHRAGLLPTDETDTYEGRLEFWDGTTETAWKVCEPTSIQHG